MKQITLLLVFASFLALQVQAQKQGEVLFTEKMKIQITLPEDSPISAEQLKKMMPGEQVSKRVLYFNDKATLYTGIKDAPDEEHEISAEEGGMRIQFKFAGASNENIVYLNLAKETLIEQRDFMGKTFLVQDKNPKLPWKLEADTKKILDYNCKKATATIDNREVEAWFTTDLAIASGPGNYFGLPGMILEVTSKSEAGSRTIMATEVNFKDLEKDQIAQPKKGKKVSSEEFKKIVEEKTKEMQEQMGSGGQRIMIRG